MDALWEGNEAAASDLMSDLLWKTISYMDYHEDYYHAFLADIFVGRGYGVESNKERRLGRPDIQLTDNVNRRVLIIEAKKSDRKETKYGAPQDASKSGICSKSGCRETVVTAGAAGMSV